MKDDRSYFLPGLPLSRSRNGGHGGRRHDSDWGRAQVRRDHALRIGVKLKDDWKELGFDNEVEADVLGECSGATASKGVDGGEVLDDLAPVGIIGVGKAIRLRLISASIYAIDELHISGPSTGTNRSFSRAKIRDEESQRHWRRHQAVQGPSPVSGGCVGTLRFKAQLRNSKIISRKNVLSKALRAMRDFRDQASTDGIKAFNSGSERNPMEPAQTMGSPPRVRPSRSLSEPEVDKM